LAQVLETRDQEKISESYGHPNWDVEMNNEYHFLMENDTWDIVCL
jgi:hypothetical protein